MKNRNEIHRRCLSGDGVHRRRSKNDVKRKIMDKVLKSIFWNKLRIKKYDDTRYSFVYYCRTGNRWVIFKYCSSQDNELIEVQNWEYGINMDVRNILGCGPRDIISMGELKKRFAKKMNMNPKKLRNMYMTQCLNPEHDSDDGFI